MFELDREILAWSRAAHAGGCGGAATVAELSDHLHCEIDRLKQEGLSDEQAFREATARLGPAPKLAAEDARNRTLFGMACQAAVRYERRVSGPVEKRLLRAHAVVWAALMIALTFMLRRSAPRDTVAYVLLFVLVPAWWISEQLLRRAMRRPREEAAR